MSTAGKDTQSDEVKATCRHCKHPIPRDARICSICNSYQDWRGSLPITSTALAVLTALISVISIAVPSAIKAFHHSQSAAYLTMPTFDGTALHIIAVNKGDAPAALIPAHIESDLLAGATKVRVRNDGAAYIPPGTQQITFDIIPLLSGDQAYKASLDVMANLVPDKAGKTQSNKVLGHVVLGVMQSNGNYAVSKIPISTSDMFKLLRDSADRCDSEKDPSFINGCIGNGSPD